MNGRVVPDGMDKVKVFALLLQMGAFREPQEPASALDVIAVVSSNMAYNTHKHPSLIHGESIGSSLPFSHRRHQSQPWLSTSILFHCQNRSMHRSTICRHYLPPPLPSSPSIQCLSLRIESVHLSEILIDSTVKERIQNPTSQYSLSASNQSLVPKFPSNNNPFVLFKPDRSFPTPNSNPSGGFFFFGFRLLLL